MSLYTDLQSCKVESDVAIFIQVTVWNYSWTEK